MFNLLRGDGRRWRASASAPLRSGFHHTYRRSLFALRRGLTWRIAGVSRRLSWRFTRTLALIERLQDRARRERATLAPHALQTAREREEERSFREELRARSVPARPHRGYVMRDTPTASPTHGAQSAQPDPREHTLLTAAQLTSPLTTNAGLPICVLKTPPSFTASVMARVAAVNATPDAASAGVIASAAQPADAPPSSAASDVPAARMESEFPSAPPGHARALAERAAPRVSAEMLWRHALALFGVYGLSALIALCSGWLFATVAPGLVFAFLHAAVALVIVAIGAIGAAWRMSSGTIGGIGVLYLALLALLAPILLVASQAPRVFASVRREA